MGIFDQKNQTSQKNDNATRPVWNSTWGIALEEEKPTGARDMHLAGFGDALKVILTTARSQYGLEANKDGSMTIQALIADDSQKSMVKTPSIELAGKYNGTLSEAYNESQRAWMKNGKKIGSNAIMPGFYPRIVDATATQTAKKKKVA